MLTTMEACLLSVMHPFFLAFNLAGILAFVRECLPARFRACIPASMPASFHACMHAFSLSGCHAFRGEAQGEVQSGRRWRIGDGSRFDLSGQQRRSRATCFRGGRLSISVSCRTTFSCDGGGSGHCISASSAIFEFSTLAATIRAAVSSGWNVSDVVTCPNC